MSSPLPTLFLTEGILKVLGGSIFLLTPSTILQNLQSAPYSPTSLSLIRGLGTQTLAFSIPLFLAARSDVRSVKSRKVVYWTLLGREGLLALGLLAQIGWSHFLDWRARKNGVEEEDREKESRLLEEGFGAERRARAEDENRAVKILRKGMWLWVVELVPFIVGRVWLLQRKGQWFE